jgi:transcriptional regulator GlxA family with amidase domain
VAPEIVGGVVAVLVSSSASRPQALSVVIARTAVPTVARRRYGRICSLVVFSANGFGGIIGGRMTARDATRPRRIVLVSFPGVLGLDLIGPAEVFSTAGQINQGEYSVEVVATKESLSTSSGIGLAPGGALPRDAEEIDTVIVPGGVGTIDAEIDVELIEWLRNEAPKARRIASVCTGALLLARAGILDGRRATTHWAFCSVLARRHPEVDVVRDPIFVRDGDVYTSAGVTAGMDLALALVEEDLGREAALEVARWHVMFLKRPGGQSQFSATLAGQIAEPGPLRDLQEWIADNLDADLSVPALASRSHMSERNFARVFQREVGMTPARYVESLRLERARIELSDGSRPVASVARHCGFGTAATMRRVFERRLRIRPTDYRARFQPALDQ